MYRKSIFRILFAVAVIMTFMGAVAQQQVHAAVKAVDLNPKITSGQMVQKVETFVVIFDKTYSMNDVYKGNTKLNQQKGLIALLDDTIPNLKLTWALRIFGEFMTFGDASSKAVYWAMGYQKPALTKTVAPYTTGQGFSPLDVALDMTTVDLRSQPGRIAVIAFSDGEDMDKYAPVAAARKMKTAYGDRVCIYTVHLGDDIKGRKMMQEIADASQCGFMVTGDSISSPASMAAFVEKVYLEQKREEPKKAIVPLPPQIGEMKREAAAATEMEQQIIEKGRAKLLVEFDFDKAVVKPKYDKEIEKLTDVMKKYPDINIAVEGHTDSIGGKQYNEKLSQRRADAIKEVMVKKFNIASTRIIAKGYGLSRPVASNATKEGRQHNRRVEAAAEYMIKKPEPVAARQEVAPVKQTAPVAAPPTTEPVKKAEPVAAPPPAEPVKKAAPVAAPLTAEPVKKAAPASDITPDGFMKADKDGFIRSK